MDSTGPAAGQPATDDDLILELRQDELNPMDRAEKLGLLRERGHTVISIARSTGLSDTTVSHYLSLLELPERDRRMVRSGELAPTRAAQEARRRRREVRSGQLESPDGSEPRTLGELIQMVMDDRRWKLADVERHTHVNYKTLWGWIQGTRNIKRPAAPGVLKQLAEDLGLPEATVFRAAGRAYEPDGEFDDDTLHVAHLYQELSPEDRAVAEQLMRALTDRAKAASDRVTRG